MEATYIVVGLGVGRGGVGRVGRLGVSRVGAGSSNGDQKSENEDLEETSNLVIIEPFCGFAAVPA